MLFAFWIVLQNKDFTPKFKLFGRKFINITLGIFFLLTFFNGLKYTILDLKYNYSGAKELAEYIESNLPENAIIMSDNDPNTVAVLYYLDGKKPLWSAMQNNYIKYVTWNDNLSYYFSDKGWLLYIRLYSEARPDFVKNKEIYAVVPNFNHVHFLDKTQPKNFKLIYKTSPTIIEYEGYRLYKYIKN